MNDIWKGINIIATVNVLSHSVRITPLDLPSCCVASLFYNRCATACDFLLLSHTTGKTVHIRPTTNAEA